MSALTADTFRGISGPPNPVYNQPIKTAGFQIPTELEQLQKAVDDLQQALGEHFGRLSSCTQPTPEKAQEACPPNVCLVPLADAIRSSRQKIESVTNALRSITSSIQL